MKMFISSVAAKLGVHKSKKQSALDQKRKSLERAYGSTLESCKSKEEIDEWLMRADPYMAEFFEE